MELPWNICPFCGTPAPGMRREHLTLDEALRPLPEESGEDEQVEVHLQDVFSEADFVSEPEEEIEEFVEFEEEPQNEEQEE